MISNQHRRTNSNTLAETPKEELESHIDRLNKVLSIAMQEIEITNSNSRVSSRFSTFHPEPEARPISPSFNSDDLNLPFEFEQKIEELLLTIDRSQMVIEDFISAEHRRETSNVPTRSSRDLEYYEKELNLRMRKNEQIEKERKNFEEKLSALDTLKEEYLMKKEEVKVMFEKLNDKEKLLEVKEKELRASRMAFDRRKLLWEQENGVKTEGKDEDMPIEKFQRPVSSNPLRCSLPNFSFKSGILSDVPYGAAPPSNESLEFFQEDLRNKSEELEALKRNSGADTSRLEMQIDQIKNKIAALRGEKVMKMSNQTTRILSNIVQTMQKQTLKEEGLGIKRKELIEKTNVKDERREEFKIKQLEVKMPEKTETKRRFLFSDAPTPKNLNTPRTCEKDDPYKVYFENKKCLIQEKEKVLANKEKLLKDVFREILVKYPEAKEIIDNLKKRTRE